MNGFVFWKDACGCIFERRDELRILFQIRAVVRSEFRLVGETSIRLRRGGAGRQHVHPLSQDLTKPWRIVGLLVSITGHLSSQILQH
jgi:hypothetical protein